MLSYPKQQLQMPEIPDIPADRGIEPRNALFPSNSPGSRVHDPAVGSVFGIFLVKMEKCEDISVVFRPFHQGPKLKLRTEKKYGCNPKPDNMRVGGFEVVFNGLIDQVRL